MTVTEQFRGKVYAAQTLYRMMRWFNNWADVWSCYRRSKRLPPLEFREGFILDHGQWDDPLALIYDAYAEHPYNRHLPAVLDGVMIDIGANIGLTSLTLAARWRKLRIHAYEPNPSTNEVLIGNVRASGLEERIVVHGEAIGAASGALKLWTNIHSVLATGYCPAPPESGATYTEVPMIDLNEAVRRTGESRITMLKIDAEGAEADILENATPATLAAVGCVALEYHGWLCERALERCRRALETAEFTTEVVPSAQPELGMLYAWR